MRKQDLYHIVGGLSAVEKKVFKEKYASRGEVNFIRLFDAIASGQATDDEEVRCYFKGENFLNHLHKTKAYLYEALLDSLLVPLQQNFIRLQIIRKLEYAEVLLSRKMLDEAEALLLDAAALAERYGEVELELLLQSQVTRLQAHLYNPQQHLKELYAVQTKTLEYVNYSQLYVDVFTAYTQRGKKGALPVESFASHPLMGDKNEPRTSKAKGIKEVLKSLIYTVQKKYDLALKANYTISRQSAISSKISPLNEAGHINSLFNICLAKQSRKEAFEDTIAELQKFTPLSEWGKSHHFICLARARLLQQIGAKPTQKARETALWAAKELKNNEPLLTELDLLKLWFSLAAVWLKIKEYGQALEYLIKINNTKEAREKRTIIYRCTQLYFLIVYFEMGDLDRLSSLLRNYRYYQKKDDTFYLIEKETAAFLSKAMGLPDKKEQQKLKQKFMAALYSNKSDLHSGLAYLEQINWITETGD